MIEVRNLTKKYGDHFAVQDISFSLEKGKIYGLLGPNGAGKSTTMNIMTGYIAATSGEVIIEGHDIFKEAEEAKKHIGYLPEIPPLYMDMTVWEYLFTVADLKGVPKSERKSMIGDVMEKVMITNMKDRLIKNLSKGYKQRVGIASASSGTLSVVIRFSVSGFTLSLEITSPNALPSAVSPFPLKIYRFGMSLAVT